MGGEVALGAAKADRLVDPRASEAMAQASIGSLLHGAYRPRHDRVAPGLGNEIGLLKNKGGLEIVAVEMQQRPCRETAKKVAPGHGFRRAADRLAARQQLGRRSCGQRVGQSVWS